MGDKRIPKPVVLALLLCLVIIALSAAGCGTCDILTPPSVEAVGGPSVLIDDPRHGDEVIVDEIVQVFATAQDLAGIVRIELWVDGSPIETLSSAQAEGTNPFPLLANWQPSTPGNHTIVVRAYNTLDIPGQASISVNGVEGPDISGEMPAEGCSGLLLMAHEVGVGETLDGIAAGFEVTVEEILVCNPGVDPEVPLTPGETLLIPYLVSPEDEEPPADPPPPPAEPPIPDELDEPVELPPPDPGPPPDPPPDPAPDPPGPPPGPPAGPPPGPPIALEFEALELEVDQIYVAVACFVELEGVEERIPADPLDYLDPVGPVEENYWDIAAELSGVNSVPVAVLSGENLNVHADCYGFFPGVIEPPHLGEFTREHPEADWNGDPIEVWSDADDGQFRVVYRICQGSCVPTVIERPFDLEYKDDLPLGPRMEWDWDGTYPIDGFRLYRDGVLHYEQPGAAERIMQIQEADVQPWCDQTWDYTLTAYEGVFGVGPQSPHSDSVEFIGASCDQVAEVKFGMPAPTASLWTVCLLPDCPEPEPDCSNCEVEIWYGTIYANGERIEREPPECTVDMCLYTGPTLRSYRCGMCVDPAYSIGLDGLFDTDTVLVPMIAGEDLTLGISLIDWDLYSPDELICEGGAVVAAANVVIGYTDYVECWADPPGPLPAAFMFYEIVNVTP